MTGYKASVLECSKELTAKEKIAIKDTTNAVQLDEAADGENVIIDFDYYAILDIHNENSDSKDYEKYIIADKNGTRYVTGSKPFFTAFTDIYEEMTDNAPDEEFSIMCYKKESKNYKGKYFLTCSII